MTNEAVEQKTGGPPGRELVSALADGQLRGREFARAVESACAGSEARATWHAYHVMGDVLRARELSACAGDAAFVARFQARLLLEPAMSLPISEVNPKTTEIIANNVYRTLENVENDSNVEVAAGGRQRWKLFAGVASMAAVGTIGWSIMGGLGGTTVTPQSTPQLAQTPLQQPEVMIRDPRLDALLAAHKQFGGTSALQMPAGFLRNATFESPNR